MPTPRPSPPRSRIVPSLALLLALLGACASPSSDSTGSAAVSVAMSQALSVADVARVNVVVTGPDMSPIAFDLSREEAGFRGILAGIAAGTDRVFEARAFDSAGAAIYASRSAPTTTAAGRTTTVILLLQQLTPPPAYQNGAPIIEAVSVSSSRMLPGGSVDLAVRARDPDARDDLSFRWSAAEGVFSTPTSATTRWTAPALERAYPLTITVTDSQGSSSTLTFNVNVTQEAGAGSSEVRVTFNSWPNVTGMTASPSQLVVGQPMQLSATGHDPDGDLLSSSWTSSCEGSFNDPASAPRTFTPSSAPVGGTCTLTVTMSDGRGGSGRGSLTLNAGGTATTNFGPDIDSYFQSSPDALARGTVTLRLGAHDPEGSAITFSWSAGSGTLSPQTRTPTSSEVTWTAPYCLDAPTSIVATVTDAAGVANTHTFVIGARDPASCAAGQVRGVRTVRHYLQDGTVVVRPADMSTTVVAAHVPRADGSGYDRIEGQGFADGTVLVDNVRADAFFLQVGTRFSWLTSHTAPDVFTVLSGRPDGVPAAPGTQLDLTLTGLAPWTEGDTLTFSAFDANVYFDLGCDATAPVLAPGATELRHPLQYSECYGGQPVLDAALGDRLWVGQYSARTTERMNVTELRRSGEAAVTTTQGAVTPWSLALTAGTAQSFTLDLRADALEAQAASPFPGATVPTVEWELFSGFDYPELRVWTGQGLARGSVSMGGAGPVTEPVSYASTLPANWGHVLNAWAYVYNQLVLPPRADGSTPRHSAFTFAYEGRQFARPVSGAVTLASTLGPAHSLRVNGQPSTAPLAGVGTEPTLSWSAPALGTPSAYYVTLYRLTGTGVFLSRSQVARFSFKASHGTTLKLPQGLVQPGVMHYAVVGASWGEDYDGSSPDGLQSQSAQVETLSHVWTP